ncbi:MAG: aldo/keto reductase [Planctomycetes bacterium]|nr:aldo/keto reductase [Planctomycetota bacterium]
MRYRRLGWSSCKVSTISLGSWLTVGWTIDQSMTNALVKQAFESGVNFFDTADVYARGAAESALGIALAPLKRADYVLASKCFWPMSDNVNDRGLSRKHLVESVHASLARLKTDYLDVMQCHRFDPDTSVDEVVDAMSDLIRQGKLLYWGVSCWTGAQIEAAVATAAARGGYAPVSNQPPYNLLERDIEQEVIPKSRAAHVTQVVFSPLAQGLLTGKYAGGKLPAGSRAADDKKNSFLKPRLTPANLARADKVAALARAAGIAPAVAALAWTLRTQDVASAIVGASGVEQLKENLAAADVDLPADLRAALDAV